MNQLDWKLTTQASCLTLSRVALPPGPQGLLQIGLVPGDDDRVLDGVKAILEVQFRADPRGL